MFLPSHLFAESLLCSVPTFPPGDNRGPGNHIGKEATEELENVSAEESDAARSQEGGNTTTETVPVPHHIFLTM